MDEVVTKLVPDDVLTKVCNLSNLVSFNSEFNPF